MEIPLASGNTNDHHLRGLCHHLSCCRLLELVIQIRTQLVHQAVSLLYDGLWNHLLRSSRQGVK